jgi:hypothetical protein
MKRFNLAIMLLFVVAHAALGQKVTNVMGASVGNSLNTPRVVFLVQFDSALVVPVGSPSGTLSVALDSTKFALVTASGQKVYASHVSMKPVPNGFMSLTFDIGSGNFAAFEGIVASDSGALLSGAYLVNDIPLAFSSGTTYANGQLETDTQGKLTSISKANWDKYIVNGYSQNYLFPQELKVGTNLGQQDSGSTTYYLQLQQSRPWVTTSSSLAFFWGVQGRWSTLPNDPFNFAKFYPVVLQYDLLFSRLSLLGGVEIGAGGFGKNGRGTGMLNYEFRFPWNLVDMTFGAPRARIHPLIDISAQFSKSWSDTTLPDTLQQGLDVNGTIRYNIPVLKNYLLQANAGANWSYQTKKVQYLYNISLGYVSDGNVRIMLEYKQGYENVTHVFDKQLLLGFAFDALNQLVPN